MTERRDGTSSRNELQDDSAATGFAAVEQALANWPRGARNAARPALVADRLVARGDIRVIEPLPWMEGRRRLAVVRRVHSEHDSAENSSGKSSLLQAIRFLSQTAKVHKIGTDVPLNGTKVRLGTFDDARTAGADGWGSSRM